MSPTFVLTALVIVATPGTGVVLTVAAGLRGGRDLAVVTAFGCTLGIVPHLAAAVTGAAALLAASGAAFNVLKVLGIGYLLYMAYTTWRDTGLLTVGESDDAPSSGRVIVNAVLANLLNPKLTLFFFAFLPQFVTPGSETALVQMLGLSGVFMAMTFVVFAAYGWFAAATRQYVLTRPRVVRRLQRGFSIAFLALAGKLATTQR